ncbi:MAG: BMA_0021/BMA_0022 family TOMM bacteriocin [Gammaproteobacteria bacterium]
MGGSDRNASPEEGDASYLESIESQHDWRIAWARAIALAWRNQVFKKLLKEKPIDAFKELGYTLPNGLTLNVEDERDCTYTPSPPESGKSRKNGWANNESVLSATITVKLPKQPKAEFQAIALADYEATGKTYPFTT